VISAFASDEQVVDPVWGHTYRRSEVTEHEYEPVLDDEEERMNREAKTFHPIYNLMRFPDALDRPSRTVTALCTRVSRESIVVPHGDRVRRLTVRERGCLQGFPVAYQFFGRSYSEKSKMIGNAIPPQFTFFIAQAMLGTSPGEVELKRLQSQRHPLPEIVPPPRPPIEPRRSYRSSRVFRAALPNLRFGSGVRFELANSCLGSETGWSVRFFYGTSKDIRVVEPGVELVKRLTDLLPDGLPVVVDELRRTVCSGFEDLDSKLLQEVWSHRSSTGLHPFEVVDLLGEAVDKVRGLLAGHAGWEPGCLLQRVLGSGRWSAKLDRNAVWIVGGLLVGGWFNEVTGVDTLN
jgi:DNA (cytosine-5)-methyltransferase 1